MPREGGHPEQRGEPQNKKGVYPPEASQSMVVGLGVEWISVLSLLSLTVGVRAYNRSSL
jgi:hypothetical protein